MSSSSSQCMSFANCYLISIYIFLMHQEANTEKIFYGLDDIKRAQDIIIVCSWSPIGFLRKHFAQKIYSTHLIPCLQFWLLLFWHFRLRVKLTSCRWMKLAFVIVSACQMVHHQKYPVKSQTKSRLELFSDTAKRKSLLAIYISLYVAVPDSSLFICDLTHAHILCKARIRSINICGTAKTILTWWEFYS